MHVAEVASHGDSCGSIKFILTSYLFDPTLRGDGAGVSTRSMQRSFVTDGRKFEGGRLLLFH